MRYLKEFHQSYWARLALSIRVYLRDITMISVRVQESVCRVSMEAMTSLSTVGIPSVFTFIFPSFVSPFRLVKFVTCLAICSSLILSTWSHEINCLYCISYFFLINTKMDKKREECNQRHVRFGEKPFDRHFQGFPRMLILYSQNTRI